MQYTSVLRKNLGKAIESSCFFRIYSNQINDPRPNVATPMTSYAPQAYLREKQHHPGVSKYSLAFLNMSFFKC